MEARGNRWEGVLAAILLVCIVPLLGGAFRATLTTLATKYNHPDTHRSKAPWLVRTTEPAGLRQQQGNVQSLEGKAGRPRTL